MQYLNSIVMMALEMIPCCCIILSVFRENLKRDQRQRAIIVGVTLLFFALISVVSSYSLNSLKWVPFASSIIAALYISFILYKITDLMFFQCVYITLLITNLTDAAKLIIRVTYPNDVVPTPVDLQYLLKVVLLFAVVFPISYLFFKNFFRPVVLKTTGLLFWNYICLIPIALHFIFRFGVYPDYFHQKVIWHPAIFILPLVWLCGVLLIHFVALRSLQYLLDKKVLEEKLHYSELLADARKRQYTSIQSAVETERRMRHDFRHTILAISSYAEQGDCSNIQKYVDDYLDPLSQPMMDIYCKNPLINTILSHYLSLARIYGIATDYTITLPEKIVFSETDLCIIVGNLVENALEACQRQTSGHRFIDIKMSMSSKHMLSLIISNSYEGDIQPKDSGYLSSKRDETGIGLFSVNQIVLEHKGMMKVTYSGQTFQVSVLLNAPQNKE